VYTVVAQMVANSYTLRYPSVYTQSDASVSLFSVNLYNY
jgi:hypothetical protein